MWEIPVTVGLRLRRAGPPARPHYFRVFILFSVVQPKLRSEKLPKLTVTWHFSLVQPRVKNARTLTVKGMI
jgi:hypothetical protein